MSKRFFPQQQGDRKRAKLDISISDHNFPLSQNKELEPDTWGDDNDDEILLLASQACEEAYCNNDLSLLPNYSICMQPGSTSTQLYSSPSPSTSKTEFTFKKPSTTSSGVISTQLREKCNRISSLLHGITAKTMAMSSEPDDVSNINDLIFSDKVYKDQDSDHVYRQLLQLKEENAKLKSENGKLLEKCVTKEGEASILRTQLKTCQASVDNVRLEKLKAQEKVQMEWTDKLAAANNQMNDLKTQLDFKNLEIISIKEKCKKLESTKVKLTQVTVGNNDISRSSSFTQNESMTQSRRVKTSSHAVQTDNMAHFLALNKTCRADTSDLPTVLPHILEATTSPYSLLDYNENLNCTDAPYKSRVNTTTHRDGSSILNKGSVIQLMTLYEDIAKISGGCGQKESFFRVFDATKSILNEVLFRLEIISQRMTAAFQKEMEDKYLETTNSFLRARRVDLLKGRELYKEEQEILARRMAAVLSYILECPIGVDMFKHYERCSESNGSFAECMVKICSLLDSTSTAVLYSGLLVSLSHVAGALSLRPPAHSARGAGPVALRSLRLARAASRGGLCGGGGAAAMVSDAAQSRKKDACYLQTLVKQVEVCLKCIENQNLREKAVETTRELIMLYSNLNYHSSDVPDEPRCDCQIILLEAIIYALRICAVMLQNGEMDTNCPERRALVAAWRGGAALLVRGAQCAERRRGDLMRAAHLARHLAHSHLHENILSELAASLHSSPEDMPPSFHIEPWLKSFESFSITD